MEDIKLLTVLMIALLVGGLGFGLILYNKEVVAEVPEIPAPVITDQDKEDIAGLVLANLPTPVVPDVVVDESGDLAVVSDGSYTLNKGEYEEEATETEAEEISLEEFNSKDFKKQLLISINAELLTLTFEGHDQFGMLIDSWRDIEDVDMELVSVEDVDVDDEDATVELKFKVEYMLDDDDEEIGKARLTIVYSVEDLDFDDDFEDAQAVEDFTVSKIKLYG